jgi:phenylacetate-CoA ligase
MSRTFIYLLLQRLIGSKVGDYYEEFFRLERMTPAAFQSWQQERLAGILQHAVREIPYYAARVPYLSGLSLSDFPVLSKDDILGNFQELMTPEVRRQYQGHKKRDWGYSWLLVKTGGSTGTPTTVIHDREFRDRGRAGRLYSQYLCGFSFGTPYFRLWGSMGDINQMRDSLSQRLTSMLAGQTLLNAFRMSDADIEKYLETINASSITHMMAYVDAAYQIANYALKRGKRVKRLESIMACAGTVTDDVRQTLSQVFQAKVHNKYGSRECADMACECEAGGLHIYGNNTFLEVVDDQGNPLAEGQRGRILVTLLSNYSFPLIRYEIGDEGALSGRQCACGRPFPLLDRLEGRKVEFLMDNDGGYVSPIYIRHLIGVVHNPGCIHRFQLIQTSVTEYDLKLEVEPDTLPSFLKEVSGKIERDLKAVLGSHSRIDIRAVQEIPVTDSGKFLYCINKVAG